MLWLHVTRGFGAEKVIWFWYDMLPLTVLGRIEVGDKAAREGLVGGSEKNGQIQIVFKGEPTGFRDGFDVLCEKKRGQMWYLTIMTIILYLVLYVKTLLPLYIEILTPSSLGIVVCRPRVSGGVIS